MPPPGKKVRRKKPAGGGGPEEKGKKKKKGVVEIDGQMYALDENGNPGKKLRKKSDGRSRPEQREEGEVKYKKKIITDEFGNKKVLRKKVVVRPKSEAPPMERSRDQGDKKRIMRRSQSMGRAKTQAEVERGVAMGAVKSIPREWVDGKGRKHIVEADGSEIIIDKNGKKMRKKKKEPVEKAVPNDDDSVYSNNPMTKGGTTDLRSGRTSNLFDKLWDDSIETPKTPKRTFLGQVNEGNEDEEEEEEKNKDESDKRESISLSAKISEVGKENRELEVKLQEKEEEVEELKEMNKKEKAKNVKVSAEMMQLKADFTEATSDVQILRQQIDDLKQTIIKREEKIAKLEKEIPSSGAPNSPKTPRRSMIRGWKGKHQDDMEDEEKKNEKENPIGPDGNCIHCGRADHDVEIKELRGVNRALKHKIEYEKEFGAGNDIKKKEEQIAFLTAEKKKVDAELEMFIRGDKPGFKANPTMIRLLDEKKKLTKQYEQEKEVTAIRIEGMEEMIDSLERMNKDLKMQLSIPVASEPAPAEPPRAPRPPAGENMSEWKSFGVAPVEDVDNKEEGGGLWAKFTRR